MRVREKEGGGRRKGRGEGWGGGKREEGEKR